MMRRVLVVTIALAGAQCGPPAPVPCVSSDGCPRDEQCIEGACTVVECTRNEECQATDIAVPGFCTSDASTDCPDDEFCCAAGERCVPASSGVSRCVVDGASLDCAEFGLVELTVERDNQEPSTVTFCADPDVRCDLDNDNVCAGGVFGT